MSNNVNHFNILFIISVVSHGDTQGTQMALEFDLVNILKYVKYIFSLTHADDFILKS